MRKVYADAETALADIVKDDITIAVGGFGRGPFAVRLGNQSQFSLRSEEAGKIMCRIVEAV